MGGGGVRREGRAGGVRVRAGHREAVAGSGAGGCFSQRGRQSPGRWPGRWRARLPGFTCVGVSRGKRGGFLAKEPLALCIFSDLSVRPLLFSPSEKPVPADLTAKHFL